jgi:hypothetical protein
MSTYLERYLAGEHEGVWVELLALGERVREEPVYSDALAVARETMRRVRHNIELLVPRLEQLGYRFGYEWVDEDELDFADHQPPVFAPPKPDVHERITELETLAGVLPLSLQAWYETVGAVNFVGMEPEHWRQLAPVDPARDAFLAFVVSHPHASAAEVQQYLREHPDLTVSNAEEEVGLDPLQVFPIDDHLEMALYERGRTHTAPGESSGGGAEERIGQGPRQQEKVDLILAPDHLHKFAISGMGAYTVSIPDLAADTAVFLEWHHTTFVNYLRICCRWGGLPGLERARRVPTQDLAMLTHDLLPL